MLELWDACKVEMYFSSAKPMIFRIIYSRKCQFDHVKGFPRPLHRFLVYWREFCSASKGFTVKCSHLVTGLKMLQEMLGFFLSLLQCCHVNYNVTKINVGL